MIGTQEKEAILAIKDFMLSMGATMKEIEEELITSMAQDKTLTPKKKEEILEILNPKNMMAATNTNLEAVKPCIKGSIQIPLPLLTTLKELKFGRSKTEQDLLDGFIDVVAKKNKELETIARIDQRLHWALNEVEGLQNETKKEWLKKALASIRFDLDE